MENNKKPEIRFAGFNDEWKQLKLSELGESYSVGTLGYSDLDENGANKCILYGELFTTYDEEINEVKSLTNKDVFIAQKNDILFPTSTTVDAKSLITPSAVNVDSVSVGGDMFGIRPKKEVDGRFISYQINNVEKIKNSFAKKAQGLTIVHIHYSDVADEKLYMPTKKEQEKIVTLCENIDSLIKYNQSKSEKLINIKKSMLWKMFPQRGNNTPEIRFSGFTDDWEQRRLGDIADIVGGGTPSTSNSEYWDGDIDWYAPAEISNQIFVESSVRKITTQGYENSSAKVLPVGTVLFTSRAGIGKTAILRKKACTNQGFQSIVPHENELDSYFAFSRTDELKRYGETVGAGSTFVEVSGKQMANMDLAIPKAIEEQQQIGAYFRNLDTLITLHQRKLEKLQNMKKAMLEKMFI